MRSAAPPITVLLYHELISSGSTSEKDLMPANRFLEHVKTLEAAGFQCVPLHEAMDIACRATDAGEHAPPKIAFTFDDGYEGLHRILPAYAGRLCATLFILPDYLGKSNEAWNTRATSTLQHMTLSQIRELADQGFAIEPHGMDHHNLLKFREADLRTRFQTLADWFQQNLFKTPCWLAYPYGACSPLIKKTAEEFFQGAVSVNHGEWFGPASRFALNRISVPSYLTGDDLLDVINTPSSRRWMALEQKAPWRGKTGRKRQNHG
jgi:peptidoglycan/xylan/chitin deacetylase (PgdA/CDA1 family)